MFNLGMGEITVILLLALIFLGPKRLPELASGLGKIIKDIRKATNDVKNEIQLDEHIRRPFEELRDAVTLPPEELKRRDRLKKELEEAKRKAEADLKTLAATVEAQGVDDPQNHPHGQDIQSHPHHDGKVTDVPPPPISAPVVVPPPFPMAGSGSGPIPGSAAHLPAHHPGSGPVAAGPPPVPHSGSGPVAHATAAPAGTVPASAGKGLPPPPRTTHRPPAPASAPASAPTSTPAAVAHGPAPARTNVTQFLSEADLIPPDGPPPMPAPVPPAPTAHTGTTPADAASAGHPPHHDDTRRDDTKRDDTKRDETKRDKKGEAT